MKAVLLSVRPRWCERIIVSRDKVYEARKSRPNIDVPFKTYIYCTKPSFEHEDFFVIDAGTEHCHSFYGGGKVIAEFACDEIIPFDSAFDEWARATAPPGSSINSIGWDKFLEIAHNGACLTREDIDAYWPEDVNAQMWHISDLKVYAEPLELSRFMRPCQRNACVVCEYGYRGGKVCDAYLKRPPQSWCYVEEIA